MEEAVQKVKQTSEIFALGSFPLHKWAANHNEVLADLPCKYLAMEPFALRDATSDTSILELFWNPTDDLFEFKLSSSEPPQIVTKRTSLSHCQAFRPTGMVSPHSLLGQDVDARTLDIKDWMGRSNHT